MDWKPKVWIATVLGLFFPPLGFLYLLRPWYALIYFLTTLAAGFLDLTRPISIYGALPSWFMCVWVVAIASASHCLAIARFKSTTVERGWYSRWWGLTSIVTGYLLAALLLRSFLFEPFRHPTESMLPTIAEGQSFLIKKLGYGYYGSYGITLAHSRPTVPIMRGDILVFRVPGREDTSYVKRVIGTPGDHLAFKNRRVTLNDTTTPTSCTTVDAQLTHCIETLDGTTYTVAYIADRSDTDFDIIVPEAHYFMMGDSRNNSMDSRYIGPIPVENIVGRVVHVF